MEVENGWSLTFKATATAVELAKKSTFDGSHSYLGMHVLQGNQYSSSIDNLLALRPPLATPLIATQIF